MEVENDRIARLSPAKRALLEARLRKSRNRSADHGIVRRGSGERAVCSFGQRRLWFLEQLEQDLAAHNVAHDCRIRGPLNIECLRRSVEAIVHRHEILRTVIRADNGEPLPFVLPPERFELPTFDLRHLAGAAQESESERLGAVDRSRPFRLDRDPILRASLHILADEEFLLSITIHHIASDGWSGAILSRELWSFYEAFLRDEQSPVEPLALQYSDYAAWQRERLQGERLESLLTFWKEQLKGVPVLELPTDRPRPSRPTFRGQLVEFDLDPEVVACLRMLSAEADATLHMTLLAAFAALLSRYCAQHDVPIGVPSAGRMRPELETLIGYFANTLVIRADLSGNPTFLELVERVRRTSLETYQHDELPFERLVEELDPQRSLDRNPLVQVLFQFTDFVRPESRIGDLVCAHSTPRHQASRFDVQLSLRPVDDGLRGNLLYAEDLFDPPTIERLIGHYQTLLKGIADNPNARLDELPILTNAERRQLLVEFNDTAMEVPRGCHGQPLCVCDLFEQQVARTPNAVAVDDGRTQLTYAELNERADRLASRLQSRGVGPECRVGVVAERTPEMVAAILAVWKAGAAYVPLDPRLPRERLDFLIEDTGTSLVIASQPLALSRSDIEFIFISPDCEDENDPPSGGWGRAQRAPSLRESGGEPKRFDPSHPAGNSCPPPHFLRPTNDRSIEDATRRTDPGDRLAYILHTSGSTGTPKGVAVVQSAIVNMLSSVRDITGFGPSNRILGLTTLSFDISVVELFLPLITGGAIRLVSQDDALDGRSLRAIVENSRVTFLQATPATWRMLVQTGWRGSPGLKAITGGESLSRELADQLLDRVETLWNMYGPTETTVYSTAVKIERDMPITIGRPIGNTRAYVLDASRNLLPVGIPGELYLGGAGLARGYWNRPELTAERFVPNPFADDRSDRLYRTGDVVRYRSNGEIELLGRADHQVKLRGFRIELGEIEAVLGQHPAVSGAAAAICDDGTQDPRLVGYFVRRANSAGSNGDRPDSAALRNYLKSKLPDYMVPALLIELPALPLTASGKLDRKSLPAPESSPHESLPESFALADVVERELAAIWKRLLRVPQIGRHDSFFDLGGHSLLAVQMLAQAERLFQSPPPLRTIFERPTLAEVAAAIREKRTRAAVATTHLRYDPAGREVGVPKPPLIIAPSLFGHSNEWDSILTAKPGDRSVYGLEVDGDEPYWSEAPSLEEMAERFCDSVCLSVPEGPFHLAGYSFGAWLAYAMACRFAELGRTPLSVILVDSQFRPARRSWRDRILQDLPSMVRNAPRWLVNQFDEKSPREASARIGRRLSAVQNGRTTRRQTAKAETNGHKNGDLDAATARASGVFDLDQFPELYRRRMILSFRAQAAYRPRAFHGRLAYLECAIRPLVHRNLEAGGWSALVTGTVETHYIPGSHGSAVTGRFAGELASVLTRVMDRADLPTCD
jgi:amino acid adenylation domain-containing protein